jgi:hypothetical protein
VSTSPPNPLSVNREGGQDQRSEVEKFIISLRSCGYEGRDAVIMAGLCLDHPNPELAINSYGLAVLYGESTVEDAMRDLHNEIGHLRDSDG